MPEQPNDPEQPDDGDGLGFARGTEGAEHDETEHDETEHDETEHDETEHDDPRRVGREPDDTGRERSLDESSLPSIAAGYLTLTSDPSTGPEDGAPAWDGA